MTYMSLFLDCFKNISVFLDWYVQGCRDMHVIRSFRKCFYSFLKYFLGFMRFEIKMCMFMWTFTRPASSDPGCLPYLYCWIEEHALQLSIIIVTLAEAVESVLLSLKIVTDLQFYLFFLINLLSSNHLTRREQEIPHLYRWWDELRLTRRFLTLVSDNIII